VLVRARIRQICTLTLARVRGGALPPEADSCAG